MAATPQASPWFDAIPLRQTTRLFMTGVSCRPLTWRSCNPYRWSQDCVAPLRAEMETALAYINVGNLHQYADHAFMDELTAWLRFNKKEAMATLMACTCAVRVTRPYPAGWGSDVSSGTKPQQQADADAEKLRSSAGRLSSVQIRRQSGLGAGRSMSGWRCR